MYIIWCQNFNQKNLNNNKISVLYIVEVLFFFKWNKNLQILVQNVSISQYNQVKCNSLILHQSLCHTKKVEQKYMINTCLSFWSFSLYAATVLINLTQTRILRQFVIVTLYSCSSSNKIANFSIKILIMWFMNIFTTIIHLVSLLFLLDHLGRFHLKNWNFSCFPHV